MLEYQSLLNMTTKRNIFRSTSDFSMPAFWKHHDFRNSINIVLTVIFKSVVPLLGKHNQILFKLKGVVFLQYAEAIVEYWLGMSITRRHNCLVGQCNILGRSAPR